MNNFLNEFRAKFSAFMYKLRSKFSSFMIGRYGADQLSRFLNVLVYVFIFLQLIFKKYKFTYVSLVLIFIQLLRCFSKNHVARAKENRIYLRYKEEIAKWLRLQKRKFNDRKDYRYKKCPNCGKTLRLPNRKGKHTVICPNCNKQFNVRIL